MEAILTNVWHRSLIADARMAVVRIDRDDVVVGGTVSAGETPDDAVLAESRHVDPVLIRAQVRAVEHDILNEKIRRLAEA